MRNHWFEKIDKWSLGLSLGKFSQDEQNYLYARVQESRARMCDIFAAAGVGFDIVLWLLRDFFPVESALWWVCRYAYVLAIIWIILLMGAKSSEAKQRWQTLGSSITMILCSWIILDLLVGKDQTYPVSIAFSLSYAIVVGSFVLLMAWVSRPYLFVVSSVSLAFSWFLPEMVEGAPNRYVACLFILFLPFLNHALHLRFLRTDIREMRVRLTTMPRRMGLSLSDADQRPRERFCVCLSSDWRGYQDLVSGLSDERVVELLEDYYQRVQDLLVVELQEYDYYMDWIADELFAVIYSRETDVVNLQARQSMAIKVVEVSQKILNMKEVFSEDHKLNLAIDIGLSSGQSLIGVIGPSNHRKATALGSNPGRARRMQGCGKLIRLELHEEDRIIFGDEMVIVLQAPRDSNLPIQRYDTSKRRLRNLEDQTLYYVTSPEQSRQLPLLATS